MNKGVVKKVDITKGFSFLTNEDYFVHVSGLCENLKSKGLHIGQKVSFYEAIEVRID